jgi:sugar lactone lactonase YvrE
VLTVEYGSGRLLRVDPSGAVAVVASGLRKPYAIARARNGTVYVTEAGELSRPTGSLRRVLPDGRTSAVPLRPPAPTRSTAAARPTLSQPFDVLPVAGGRLLVTDLPAGLVYSIEPARRTGRVVAHVFQARELARLPDGRILVTSREKVLALDPRTGKTSLYATAKNYILGIAVGPDGSLYASENIPFTEKTTLVRLHNGTKDVLLEGTRGIHEFLVGPDGLLLPESYAGRVLRLDLVTGKVDVLATALANPSSALPAAAGGWFISEFMGRRVSHLWPDGRVTAGATVVTPGAIAFDAHHRIVGVTMGGTIFRIERGRARTIYP